MEPIYDQVKYDGTEDIIIRLDKVFLIMIYMKQILKQENSIQKEN